MSHSPIQRYDPVASALHWATALAIIVVIGLGLTTKYVDLPKARAFEPAQLRKSIGVTILLLAVARLFSR